MNFYNLFFSELEISASRSGFARDEKEKKQKYEGDHQENVCKKKKKKKRKKNNST